MTTLQWRRQLLLSSGIVDTFYTSVFVLVVLVPPVVVTVVDVEDLLLPAAIAQIRIIKIAPPATQTQGAVYHSVLLVVVVVTLLIVLVLSWLSPSLTMRKVNRIVIKIR